MWGFFMYTGTLLFFFLHGHTVCTPNKNILFKSKRHGGWKLENKNQTSLKMTKGSSTSNAQLCTGPVCVQPDLMQHCAVNTWQLHASRRLGAHGSAFLFAICTRFVGNKLHRIDNEGGRSARRYIGPGPPRINIEYRPSEHGSILTEVEKLLHGERRRGEFREMLDMFGHAGQRRVFHDKPDELHCRCWETGLR